MSAVRESVCTYILYNDFFVINIDVLIVSGIIKSSKVGIVENRIKE